MNIQNKVATLQSRSHHELNILYFEREEYDKLSFLACPLCELRQSNGHVFSCTSCPIYEKTKEVGCEETPFFTARNTFNILKGNRINNGISLTETEKKDFISKEQAEVDFLTEVLYG